MMGYDDRLRWWGTMIGTMVGYDDRVRWWGTMVGYDGVVRRWGTMVGYDGRVRWWGATARCGSYFQKYAMCHFLLHIQSSQ